MKFLRYLSEVISMIMAILILFLCMSYLTGNLEYKLTLSGDINKTYTNVAEEK